jgi:hypothetical protein
MSFHHPSGQPHWDSPAGRGLPAIPPPERERSPSAGEERAVASPSPTPPPARSGPSVAEWLGWSPTSWRARGAR